MTVVEQKQSVNMEEYWHATEWPWSDVGMHAI